MNTTLQLALQNALYQKYGKDLTDFSIDSHGSTMLFTLPLNNSFAPSFDVEIAFHKKEVIVYGVLPVNKKRYNLIYRLKDAWKELKEGKQKKVNPCQSFPMCFYDVRSDSIRTENIVDSAMEGNVETIVKSVLGIVQRLNDCFQSLDERTVYHTFFKLVHIKSIRDLTEDKFPFFE